MRQEFHLLAFEERKETIFKWAIEVRGIEHSQHIIGDNASKAITELLTAFLHKHKKVDAGFQLNHAWFKSEKVYDRLPEFDGKHKIVGKMIKLEKLCEQLSYGAPKPIERLKEAIELFKDTELLLKEV
ncbi:hypothetical protein HY484_01785 [Candidatus Woesearchaeota archaeon]|nr:hypothetical protein [Candidatus Woesearchaeota archaeon]